MQPLNALLAIPCGLRLWHGAQQWPELPESRKSADGQTNSIRFLGSSWFFERCQKLPNAKLVIRYLILLSGLFFMGLGISLTTKSNLGTSPISSVPYVLSMMFPLTFGQFTFLLSLVCLLIQVIILRKTFKTIQYMQILVGVFFGLFIDIGMFFFTSVNPEMYVSKIMILLSGCILLAFGVYLQIAANVIINPGEGVVKTIAKKVGVKFGNIKIAFDLTLLITAIIISLCAFRTIKGVREGTILSALLVGCLANGFNFTAKHIRLSNEWLDYLSDSENS
jgi:uncharacterized membrane protein YczE